VFRYRFIVLVSRGLQRKVFSMNKLAAILILTGSIMLAAGCGSDYQNYQETFLKQGVCQDSAPTWVASTTPLNIEHSDYLYFVGRGIAYNTLDERSAYDNARDHAMQQLAGYIGTHVVTNASEADKRCFAIASGIPFVWPSKSNRFLPGEKSKQGLSKLAYLVVDAVAGDLEDMGTYWEQYELQELPPRLFDKARIATRYKCWVKMGVPKATVLKRIAEAQEQMALIADAQCCPETGSKCFAVTSSHRGSVGR